MKEIFFYFLRLGALGFGGPLALVAQMQKDLVQERKWISNEEFAQGLALIKSMPGPLAFSTASYLGTKRGGFWGGQLAGWCLVLPAFLMMLALGYYYESFSQISWVNAMLAGMQAAAMALIIFSIKGLAQGYFRIKMFWFLMLIAGALTWAGLPEPIVILGMGGASLVIRYWRPTQHSLWSAVGLISPLSFFADEKIRDLTWICLKSGAVVFGTGLAMVPILEHGFVHDMHWMTHGQFMDALAFGQMTPGPVLITVTFVGFKVAGFAGALIATVSIFFASSVHMTTWFPRMTGWLAQQKWVSHFVFGALAAVIATLVLTTGKLLWAGTWQQAVLTGIGLACLFRWKIPSWMMVIIGGVVGLLVLTPA